MSSGTAKLVCAKCGYEEDPLEHKYQSSCGGKIFWKSGELRCVNCDMKIYKFQCDGCGRMLDKSAVEF